MYAEMKDRVIENLTIVQVYGSGCRFRSIVSLKIFTAEYKNMKGASYIKLPKSLEDKKAIINMQNKDEECFKWSVTRASNTKIPRKLIKNCKNKRRNLTGKVLTSPLAGKISTNLKRITQLFL